MWAVKDAIITGADVNGVTLIHQVLGMHVGSFEDFDDVVRSMVARGLTSTSGPR